ncbi:hypothetical protein LX76_04557 [Cereibacter changlensis]|uniref:Uncharacterized protein n=1 Tax=Cereibacter changlensis TaxID=402884 RepID=A0A2W7QEM6_9RHOB|nr:hypothetical protein LX76_04557 [Cereibacter changlensis]
MQNPNLKGSREERKLSSRQAMESHVFGFLKSLSEACILHFHFTDCNNCPRNLMNVSRAQLLIFTVRSLETLIRDCLLICALHDHDFLEKLIEEKWRPKDGKFDMNSQIHLELLFSKISTQNFELAERYFGVFFGQPLFEKLKSDSSQPIFQLNERDELVAVLLSFPECKQDIIEIFQYRHEAIHNAHFNLDMPQAQLNYFLELVLLFGQAVCLSVGNCLLDRTEDKLDQVRAGENLYAVRFSEYAKFMQKIVPPKSQAKRERAAELIGERERAEQAEGFPPTPEKRMGIGPFYFRLKDLLRLNLDEGRWGSYDPTNSMHLFHLSDTGRIEISTLRRS